MKTLLFIILAGCAVRSEDINYYVIEVPDEPLRVQKTFKVYWNVPTMQCASKRIHFESLYERFGIIQNAKDRFKGEKVTILYDPGLFPALFKNESSGRFRFRNGGVPQEGDLDIHLVKFKQELDESIPDENFSGVGIIDFESWRPVFRQNFGTLQPYKDVSFEIERNLHPWWKKSSIEAEARHRFTSAARTFMESTLVLAKRLRPQALWGFYGFPYCFNMAANNKRESCAKNVPQENDQVPWLWSQSTALYPSLYSFSDLTTSQLASLIRGRIHEASRHSRGDILPYLWYRYRDGGFLKQNDLNTALSTIYNSAATGIIIWGSSNDVNTVPKCNKLFDYIENTFGPAIAKYTKRFKDETDDRINEVFNATNDLNNATENADNVNITTIVELDPDFHWNPPANYTEEIKKHVEQEINTKLKQNTTNSAVLYNDSVLDLIFNYVFNDIKNNSIENKIRDNVIKDEKKSSYIDLSSTTEMSSKLESTSTSQVTSNIITKNPIHNKFSDINTHINIEDNITSTEGVKSVDVTTDSNISNKKETDENNSQTYINLETSDFDTTMKTADESILNETPNDYETAFDTEDDFFNFDGFPGDFTTTRNDYGTTQTSIAISTTENDDYSTDEEELNYWKKVTSFDDDFGSDSSEYLDVDISNEFTTENTITDNNFKTNTSKVDIEPVTISTLVNNSTELNDTTTTIPETTSTHDYETSKGEIFGPKFRNVQTKFVDNPLTSPENITTTEILPDLQNYGRENVTESELKSSTNNDILEKIQSKEDSDVTISPALERTKEEITTIASVTEQVTGSASRIKRSKYFFCIMFYLYSASKCVCWLFGQC